MQLIPCPAFVNQLNSTDYDGHGEAQWVVFHQLVLWSETHSPSPHKSDPPPPQLCHQHSCSACARTAVQHPCSGMGLVLEENLAGTPPCQRLELKTSDLLRMQE
jgi:hypothetical protein